MIDDLTIKEKGFSDDFDLDEEKQHDKLLIVKKNFYVATNVKDEFIFVPTGSSIKFIKYNKSTVPYYEISTYIVELGFENRKLLIRGSRTINSRKEVEELAIRNCTCTLKEDKPYLDYNKTLPWGELFVQSFESILNV